MTQESPSVNTNSIQERLSPPIEKGPFAEAKDIEEFRKAQKELSDAAKNLFEHSEEHSKSLNKGESVKARIALDATQAQVFTDLGSLPFTPSTFSLEYGPITGFVGVNIKRVVGTDTTTHALQISSTHKLDESSVNYYSPRIKGYEGENPPVQIWKGVPGSDWSIGTGALGSMTKLIRSIGGLSR